VCVWVRNQHLQESVSGWSAHSLYGFTGLRTLWGSYGQSATSSHVVELAPDKRKVEGSTPTPGSPNHPKREGGMLLRVPGEIPGQGV